MTHGSARIKTIFANSVLSIDCALNQIVIRTLSGMAQAAAITIEGMGRSEILGTIGGDDTVLVITPSEQHARRLTEALKELV